MSAILLIAGLGLLVGGAEGLVRGGVGIAIRLRVPAAIVGLTLVAWATSAPELVTSITAAHEASTDMALGNILGSSIANIALVLALAALIRPVPSGQGLAKRDWLVLMATQSALVLMALDGQIGRIDGALLVLGGVLYNIDLVRRGRRERSLARASINKTPLPCKTRPWPLYALIALAGGGALAAGSYLFITGASTIAHTFGLSDRVVGLTVVAIGTSAPELATSVLASLRGQQDVSVGNVVGSNLFNALFALGITALVFPIVIPGDQQLVTWLDIALVLLLTLALGPALLHGRRIGRVFGGGLLSVWLLYILFLILC